MSSGSRGRGPSSRGVSSSPGRLDPGVAYRVAIAAPPLSSDRFAADETLLTDVLREVIALGDGPAARRWPADRRP
jgi:hypothetical protein